ncbi:DUF1499 domain-containing protein [Rhodopirellula bahusiensis]|uniref:DUF1499 domain-containing protein n=1 Tax=Rhodopirellula bahusiensis TaxID=2014065 RepID=A0A2G1W929_9BACT|nr:DUF1499 domain-containing protein [Rhodopirellula bahusiensis]PHQ35537.1 hypothetical protein CEE69_10385 [Rhodopirellula bahusiensis]
MTGTVIAGVVTLAIVARVATLVDDWGRDWTTNHAKWDDSATDPEMRPMRLHKRIANVQSDLKTWVESEPIWQVESIADDSVDAPVADQTQAIHLTRRTRWLRFVDDVHVQLTEEVSSTGEVVTRVDAESQSRVGKGDLGQNPRNLKHLREAFSAE